MRDSQLENTTATQPKSVAREVRLRVPQPPKFSLYLA